MAKRTSGRWYTAQSTVAPLVGVGLLALLLVGSPGCGCGDDNFPTPPPPPVVPQPVRCCCDLQWEAQIPPVAALNVLVALENVDPSFDATVAPTFFPAVGAGDFVTVTVCVAETHTLGATLHVVYTDQATAVELARAVLVYDQQCVPRVSPQTVGIFMVTCPP